jgi:biopolymer transport protein TolR
MGPIDDNSSSKRRLLSDINVTPLVDVMLVLLIIFMITAPMMTQGLDVDLPETTARPLPQEETPIVVTIEKNGEISLNQAKGSPSFIREQLAEMARSGRSNNPVLLRADREVPYGLVAALMADIKEAGFDRLGMVTQPKTDKPQR